MDEIGRDLENAHLDQLIERRLVAQGANLFHLFGIDVLHTQGNQLARIWSWVTERSQATNIVRIYMEDTQRDQVSGIKTAHARCLHRVNPGSRNAKQGVRLQLLRFQIVKSHLE